MLVDGEEYKTKVRIRGKLAAHYSRDDYWSWKIKFPKNKLYKGIRVLNFIVAYDRQYSMDAFSSRLARENGLLTLRDGFGFLNVKNKAGRHNFYYIVEAPGKEFLEGVGYKLSSIFRSQALSFEKKATSKHFSDFLPYKFKNYTEKKVDLSAKHAYLYKTLYGSGDLGEIKTLLDTSKVAVAHAIAAILGTNHGLHSQNSYMYFSETTGLFEPIIFDMNLDTLDDHKMKFGIENAIRYHSPDFYGNLLQDSSYRLMRLRILSSWSKNGGQEILSKYKEFVDEIEASAAEALKEGFEHRYLDGLIQASRNALTDKLSHNLGLLDKHLSFERVYTRVKRVAGENSLVSIEIENPNDYPVLVSDVEFKIKNKKEMAKLGTVSLFQDSNQNNIYDKNDSLLGVFDKGKKRKLKLKIKSSLLASEYLKVKVPLRLFVTGLNDLAIGKLSLSYTNPLTNSYVADDNQIYEHLDARESEVLLKSRLMGLQPFLKNNPEFELFNEGIKFRKDVNELKGLTVIPENIPLFVAAGTKLLLHDDASVISFSRVKMIGQKDNPIQVRAKNSKFGSFSVVGAKGISRLEHVIFDSSSESSFMGMFFTGGVNFYSSDVEIINVSFQNGKGEDGLNIKNAKGLVKRSRFINNPSDALDLDFSDVRVTENYFYDNKGDSIDVSGSETTFDRNVIIKTGDKGISVGEYSNILIENNYIEDANFLVASKDLSKARVNNNLFNCPRESVFTAYQKKEIFGGGRIDAVGNIAVVCPLDKESFVAGSAAYSAVKILDSASIINLSKSLLIGNSKELIGSDNTLLKFDLSCRGVVSCLEKIQSKAIGVYNLDQVNKFFSLNKTKKRLSRLKDERTF
ncbi:MAG: right-handed parallel beta-helix repeat-containing protein [Bdellovibrionales bacterium]